MLDLVVDYIDIREDLENLNDNNETTQLQYNKCPEIKITLNNVEVIALIDSGSQLNGISESWYNNKDKLGRIEILNLSNTNIKGALGTKSKLVRRQVLLEVKIAEYQFDLVFIIPGLN